MPIHLNWHVGKDEAVGDPPAPATTEPRGHSARTRSLRAIVAALYIAALAVAAVVGFAFGRWNDVRSTLREDIESVVRLEALAWQDADIGLYESTLDPTDAAAYAEALREFARTAPVDLELQVRSTRSLGERELCVEVERATQDATRTELRKYVFDGRNWRRSHSDCETDS